MIKVEVKGLRELGLALKELTDAGEKFIVPNALRKAAKPVRDAARSKAPVLKSPDSRRKAGTLKKNIVVVKEKGLPKGLHAVRVKVRPLSGKKAASFKQKTGLNAKANPNDPFYWAAVEKGGGNAPAQPYLRPAFDATKAEFTDSFIKEVSEQVKKTWAKYK